MFFVALAFSLLTAASPEVSRATAAEVTRTIREALDAAPGDFEKFSNPDANAEFLPLDPKFGKPSFSNCSIGHTAAIVILECLDLGKAEQPPFASRNSFMRVVRTALPIGYFKVDCPARRPPAAKIHRVDYLACFKSASGTQLNLFVDLTPADYERYDFDVVAPAGEDWRVRGIRRLIAAMQTMARHAPAKIAGTGWLDAPTRSAAGEIAQVCRYANADGRAGVVCEYGKAFGSEQALTAAFELAMPDGFKRVSCATAFNEPRQVPHKVLACSSNGVQSAYLFQDVGYSPLEYGFLIVDRDAPAVIE